MDVVAGDGVVGVGLGQEISRRVVDVLGGDAASDGLQPVAVAVVGVAVAAKPAQPVVISADLVEPAI